MKMRSKHGTFKHNIPKNRAPTPPPIFHSSTPLPPKNNPKPITQNPKLAKADPKPQTPNPKLNGADSKLAKADPPNPKTPPERRVPARQVQTPSRNHSPGDHSSAFPAPAKLLESAIAERLKSQSELSDLHTLLAEKSARLAALETSGDLADASVLAEISRLQTLTALLPRRIAAKQEEDANAEQALIQVTNQFIREHLGPRIRQLIARTKAVVEREMSPHFSDPAALILAVAGSERLRRVQALDWSVSLTPAQGAIKHAEAALNSWTSADEFEKRLTPNKPNE